MSKTLVRFELAGIPVRVRPWFVLVALLGGLGSRGLTGAAIWFAVVTASVLWHELGHALVMKAFGNDPWIELHAMGGAAHWPHEAAPTPMEELLAIAAGPAAGLALGAALWALSETIGPLPPPAEVAVRDALWVNVWWSLFNVLPMLPLDGGQLLDQLSRLRTGRSRPGWVGVVSVAVGAAVVALAMKHGRMYVALLGGIGMTQGLSRMGAGGLNSVRRETRRSSAQAREHARRAFARGDLVDVAAALLPEARLGKLGEAELARLVGALVRLGREEQVVSLCRDRLTTFARKGRSREWVLGAGTPEFAGRGDEEALARLAAEALTDAGADEEALVVSQLAFQQLHIPYHAHDAALTLVRLGRHDQAIHWLSQAIAAGLGGGEAVWTDPELDPLRDRADFVELATRAAKGRLLN